MSQLVKSVSWLMAGAALYHLGSRYLVQSEQRRSAAQARFLAVQARRRLYHQLTAAYGRGLLGCN